MAYGTLQAAARGSSVVISLVVIRSMLFPVSSVNHRLPSGPVVMPSGSLGVVGIGNWVIAPLVVIRPILFPEDSVNQTLPSGPRVMPKGALLGAGSGNSVMVPTLAQAGEVVILHKKSSVVPSTTSLGMLDCRRDTFIDFPSILSAHERTLGRGSGKSCVTGSTASD